MNETESPIPAVEVDLFADVVHDAINMGYQGELSAGYTGLLVGVDRALQQQAAGEPWACELLARWRRACLDYARMFGVALS
jgi:hypothetical protein